MSLYIAKNLKLPDEAVTQTFAILAKRGVGKTYTASVMAEEMLKANLHTVIVDPIGVWWGLRSAANGKGAGLKIVIAGGDHADVPIDPSNGKVLADLVVNEKLSVVIDLSLFRKGEQVRFMTDFAEILYHRNRSAVHLIVDEADAFAPQRAMRGQERMLGAMEDLVRRGRARGIGVTMITQRPAVLNKDVLTQIEVLVALRIISPQDRAAIDAWIQVHGDPGQREELMESLPSLPIGTAWFWSPGWLDIFKRVEVRKRETLDSSSTPKVGGFEKFRQHKMAKVDLAQVRKQLAATIEHTQAQDPKLLRRRIVELEREISKPKAQPQVEVKEIPVLSKEDAANLEKAARQIVHVGNGILDALGLLPEHSIETKIVKRFNVPKEKLEPVKPMKLSNDKPYTFGSGKPSDNSDVKITGGARRILEVLGARNPMRFTRAQLATLSKLSPRSGTYGTYLSLLRSNGLIDQEGDQFFLTTEGLAFLGDVPLKAQTVAEVISMWRNNLTGGARRMFDVLVDYYPADISREELGQRAEISPTSGTFGTYLSMLVGNGLVERNNQHIKASDNLFVGGKV